MQTGPRELPTEFETEAGRGVGYQRTQADLQQKEASAVSGMALCLFAWGGVCGRLVNAVCELDGVMVCLHVVAM